MRTGLFDPVGVSRSVTFGYGNRTRYLLTRTWGWQPASTYALFVLLNPSVADARQDDPTIKRCMSFARAWGHRGMMVVNVCPWVSSDPRALVKLVMPAGALEANVGYVRGAAREAKTIVCAWGAHPEAAPYLPGVIGALRGHKLYCFGTTAGGHPRHPLYVKASTALVRYRPASV